MNLKEVSRKLNRKLKVMSPFLRRGDSIFFQSYFMILFIVVVGASVYFLYRLIIFLISLRRKEICEGTCYYQESSV